jgi:hypothetical protein
MIMLRLPKETDNLIFLTLEKYTEAEGYLIKMMKKIGITELKM